MYHILKKFRNGEKMTLWLLKSKWEILIEWFNCDCLLGTGWSLFARDLELRLGDTCVFETTANPLEFNVCVFRQEQYDFVMFNPDLHGVKIFQLVSPHSLDRYRMVLPISFGYCLEQSLSSIIEFVMPNDQTWSISYEENPPRFSLLKDFASFYGLKENFILIFEYLGNSRFFVRIFGENGLEILYLKSSKSLGVTHKHLKSKYPFDFGKGEEGFVKDYIQLPKEIYEFPRLSSLDESNIVYRFTLALDCSKFGEKINNVYVCNSLVNFSGDWINGGVSRLIAHGRQWRVEVKFESNICRFGQGFHEFARDNDLVAGDICTLKLVNFLCRFFRFDIIRV